MVGDTKSDVPDRRLDMGRHILWYTARTVKKNADNPQYSKWQFTKYVNIA